ncbi:hypothetical protein PYW07_009305 [Mythimna separata]|uniref:Peptidase S1 domain-containing protein n=1 Tax=Mythimna separata TaxID=271217 RepID=A0AAD8DMH1_MYTSE|nr:hypothetical protein PYW07_009305 [Mythimna separata]
MTSSFCCTPRAYTNDFVEKNLKSIYVRLVSDHTTDGGETIPVENLYFHPQFNPKNLQNNLAIIRMEKRIRFSRKQKKIRRILWDKTPGVLPNETKQILILGWGPSKKGQVTQEQPKLRVSMLDVYNTTDCRKKYTENFIAKENFCAAYNGTNGSACNGDVGGPAIVGGILMGVVSFGAPECGAAGEPTVFTKLGYYVPWIENVMNAHKKRNQFNYDNIDTRRKNKHSSKKRLKGNKTANDKLHVADNDYPDEELAIKEALLEVINDEQSLVHDVLYGDLYDEFRQFFKPEAETDLKKDSIRTKKQKTNQFKPKEETDLKKNTIPTEKQRTTQPTTTNLKFDLESDSEHSATTEIAIRSTVLDIRKGDSEYETDNDSVQKDYSDNYEKSSKEERGLSIEIPTSTTKKSLRNKENSHGASSSSNSESKTDGQVSDESTDYSKEIREFFDKTRDKSKNKKYSKKRSDTIDSARSILENGREKRTREVLIKLEHFSKQARSVLDEGKAFATKTFIFDFEPTDVLVNKDKPKLKNSKSERDSRKNKDIVKPDKKIPQSIYLQF